MKHISLIVFALLPLICSCHSENQVYESPESVFVEDRDWKNILRVKSVGNHPTESSFIIRCGLVAESHINEKIEAYFCYPSYAPINKSRTPAENYAIEKILERNKVFKDYYYSSVDNTQEHHSISNVYVRDSIRVYADKALFGKNAGEDLSSFFSVFYTTAMFKCAGPEYGILKTDRCIGSLLNEYFVEGVMMPTDMYFSSTMMPEELTEDYTVTLTFVFPVTIEHYWSWLLEQYSNPNAEESFTETEMVLEARISGDMGIPDWFSSYHD